MIGLDEESIYSLLFIFFLTYCMRGKVYPIVTKMYNDYNFFKLFLCLFLFFLVLFLIFQIIN